MDDEKPSPFADLLTGAAWFVLAAAIVIGSWRMDRLEHLGATLYTLPGLVPGMLGAIIGLMAVILMLRSLSAGALAGARTWQFHIADHWRLFVVLVLGLIYAVGFVGHGLPFWLVSALFVTLLVFIFQFAERRANGTLARGAVFAAGFGIVAGLVIHYGFQDIFLVRVP